MEEQTTFNEDGFDELFEGGVGNVVYNENE